MANKAILCLILLLLAISACAQTGTEIKAPEDKNKDSDKIAEPSIIADAKQISQEVKELLDTADKKVESLRYSYKGPETKDFIYDFYVKGDKIKYILQPDYKVIDIDKDAYNAVYIDRKAKTAEAYCDARNCIVKGKKADLDYDDAYILTPLDWLGTVESAEKKGEELIEQRNTWKISTNSGTLWLDTFFGVPLRAESGEDLYQFQKMAFNDVKDEDVMPK